MMFEASRMPPRRQQGINWYMVLAVVIGLAVWFLLGTLGILGKGWNEPRYAY